MGGGGGATLRVWGLEFGSWGWDSYEQITCV